MTYTLSTKEGSAIDSLTVTQLTTLGRAFEKAVELLAYMETGVELLIVNDLGNPVYSVVAQTERKFTITELA